MSRSPCLVRSFRRASFSFAALALALRAEAQEPLFTFVQVSDSQPETTAHNQAFVDVLRTIAEAGQPGKLLPRPVDLVLFAGDITFGNTRTEWVAAKQKLDSWLTANDIPFLAVPGNHDVNPDRDSSADTTLYREFIGDPGVWDAGSAAFTGQNGRSRSTFWQGLRFIGVNNSNPGWNQVSTADAASVAARVNAAAAAGENAFILAHHPHNENSRVPLASALPNTSLVGYLHGHNNDPLVKKGLTGVSNPSVWDVNTNAIYLDRDLVYFEVFPTKIEAHVVILNNNPTSLPAAQIITLPHPLTLTSEPGIGFADAVHAGARAQPTGRSPERKLWFADGSWWGVLWSDAAAAYRIHRLDRASQSWSDTTTSVSSTASRSFDVLAEGSSLLIASNVATSPGAMAGGSPGQLSRFTLSETTGRYALDAGFPVTITDARSPTLVLARDSFGTLWAAWTRGGSAFVAHSLGDESAWSAPLVLTTGLSGTDTIALAAFGGAIGALWSNSNAGALGFARHFDGDADTAWSGEVATSQTSLVGSTFDLLAVDGRALAAVRAPSGALNLFERSLGGAWSVHALADAADALDDPLLVVDRAFGLLRLFAGGPTLADQSVGGGGALYVKVASLGALDFPAGRGTPVVQDGAHPSATAPSSTRQEVDALSDLVVLGSVTQTTRYWHAYDALATRPLAPTAEFTASPLAGPAPLLVTFTDLSSGSPTHWSWDFGDGTGSTAAEPQHVFAQSGSYTVTLTASNGGGEDARTRTAYVNVSAPSPVQTFLPVADARVNEASPSTNAGTDVALRVKAQAGSSYQTFLRFDLGTLSGTVSSAKLRLFCSDESNGGGGVYRLSTNTWSETTINWSNKPTLPPGALATMGAVAVNAWTEIELGPAAVSSGLVSLAVAGGTTNSAIYSSREGANPPQLVLTLAGAGTAPTANFTGTPLSGPAPLTVAFTDTSSGAPTAWTWDFGDGSGASVRNPSHVYTTPGTYSVLLEVSNASGPGSLQRLDYVTVTAPSPVSTFVPVADTLASEASPSKNFGSDASLRVRSQSGNAYQSFLRFDLASLSGGVLSAKLRLFCSDASPSGGNLYALTSAWTETGLTWNNRPALPPSALTTLGAVSVGAWIEVDVTPTVTGAGQFAFALTGASSNTAIYSSRSGANPPQLVVTTGAAQPPTANFSAAPLSGPAPLLVSFSDLSTGATSWLWDFGDGGGSSAQNPSHAYAAAGTYSVTLQTGNAAGNATLVRTDLITVGSVAPTRTFLPVADARVNEANPSSNAGTDIALRVRQDVNGSYHTYLRFDLGTLSGTVTSAKLRLFSTDGSNVAGLVFPTTGSWTETGVNWTNKPGPSGALLTTTGTVANNAWAEFDVTAAVSGPGVLNLVLQSTSTNSCFYSSREGANPPELVITTSP